MQADTPKDAAVATVRAEDIACALGLGNSAATASAGTSDGAGAGGSGAGGDMYGAVQQALLAVALLGGGDYSTGAARVGTRLALGSVRHLLKQGVSGGGRAKMAGLFSSSKRSFCPLGLKPAMHMQFMLFVTASVNLAQMSGLSSMHTGASISI